MDLGHPASIHPRAAHIAYLYRDDEERRAVVAEFVRSGLAAGEFVAYVADAPHDEVKETLEQLGILPLDAAYRGELLTASARETYCPDNHFDPEGRWRGFTATTNAARRAAFPVRARWVR